MTIYPFTRQYCVFIRLPFGLAPATFLFQTFSETVKRGIRQILNIESDVYIDDWLFWSDVKATTASWLSNFETFCNHLGIIVHPDKREGPAQSLAFLGLVIDTSQCKLRMTEEKRTKYRLSIAQLLCTETPVMDTLAGVAGKMVHIAAVHTHG